MEFNSIDDLTDKHSMGRMSVSWLVKYAIGSLFGWHAHSTPLVTTFETIFCAEGRRCVFAHIQAMAARTIRDVS